MQASQKTSDVQEEEGPPKYITLQARDGTLDEPVDARILLPSDLLRSMLPEKLSEIEDDFQIPLQGVDKAVLEKVVEYLHLYREEPMYKIEKPLNKVKLYDLVQPQYDQFINALHYKTIFQIIDAANFLGIEPLLSLSLAWVAFVLKGPTVEEFKKLFTIHNDFTPEEEAIFRREYLLPRRNRTTSEGGRERGASGNSNSS
ncbi:hypothetical protein NSK_001782 [Nannochloropsis salina CCMP1776]|uniref:SKP1 component POZ domain-containing protein n=1 Tax=Nannochloropsis salina CCMP1776 TaxID=1027361 RepID=A0A4D9D6P6_9STRA|nr:hypothetical protein NSK_001782 [Nannochloropsis salina CCMP1776]|eukprot:TFJ86694.1 hypothetical protein NSK_001782 [Nannochloropsis salina CCMP1776]